MMRRLVFVIWAELVAMKARASTEVFWITAGISWRRFKEVCARHDASYKTAAALVEAGLALVEVHV